ncbi:hypothetical protein [Chitinophaga alhagiae]|uniref:hypothetical protein n=1 Tax=Chitinophaga alhagiae TaxID=2203219 RepID=UPI000E5C1A8B|nr:hypothetical protein [Chitinophaga alhagiae]
MQRNPMAGIVMLLLMPLLINARSPGTDTTGKPSQQPVPEFKNAYNIALSLTTHYGPTGKDSIINTLAALAWYAGVKEPRELPDKIKRSEYGILAMKVNALLNNIVNPDGIFSWTETIFNERYQEAPSHKAPLLDALKKAWDAGRAAAADSLKMNNKKREIDTTERHLLHTKDTLVDKENVLRSNRKDLASITDPTRIDGYRSIIDAAEKDSSSLARSRDSLIPKLSADLQEYERLEKAAAGQAEKLKNARIAVWKLLEKPEYDAFKAANFSPVFTGVSFSASDTEKLQNELKEISKGSVTYEQYVINSEQAGLTPLSFKMPSQADMIEALAIYLAKRVKQETVLWFFETLRRSADANELIREGFPETVKLLESGAIYETPNMGSAWRYALSKDFISFPQHAFESKWLQAYVPESGQNILNDLRTGVTIARLLQQQYSYNDIVRYLYMDMLSSSPGKPAMSQHIVSLLYGLQYELLVKTGTGHRSLAFEDFDRMDNNTFMVMLELIDLRYHKCVAGLTGWKTAEKNLAAGQVQQLKTWIGKLQFTINQIQLARKELDKAISALNNKPDISNFTFSHYSVWKFFEELMRNALPDSTLTGPGISTYRKSLQYLAQAQEIYELLEKKNYSGAIGATFNVLDAIMESAADGPANMRLLAETVTGKKDDLPKSLAGAYQKVVSIYKTTLSDGGLSNLMSLIHGRIDTVGLHFETDSSVKVGNIPALYMVKDTVFANAKALEDYICAAVLHNAAKAAEVVTTFSGNLLLQHKQEYYDVRQSALRIASFLNDVSLAGDSKQLARVIESYAMPPGSYKRKRNVWYSLDLNAFVGAYAGGEFPVKTFNRDATNVKGGGVWGLSAPIGISWSRTIGKKAAERTISKNGNLKNKRSGWYTPSGHTFSFTLSVVDIGAVVSYRFTNTESVRPQEFKWDQLVSPGIHAGWGIPGTPLVINTGFVFTPQLRRVEAVTGETAVDRQFNTFRLYGGIFFDIPLFNLWERKSITRR